MMEMKMQTGTASFPRKFWIYMGDPVALKSASDDEIWDEFAQRILEHLSIEKDGRRKNLKKKVGDLVDNFSIIRGMFCELHQRNYLRKRPRDIDALKLALRNAAAKNVRRNPIVRTGAVFPIGLRAKSRPV